MHLDRDRLRSFPGLPVVLYALVLGLELGCAGPAPEPVAVANVNVDRLNVPLGGLLKLNLRFDPVEPLREDYRVSVRFLSSDERTLWTDDHDPAVPTSRWEPGETVEYTRSILFPMYPYLGDVTLAVGLYSPESGEGVPLAGQALGEMVYRVATIEIEPQHESSILVYEDGWHQTEFDATTGDNWRWTSGRAVIAFRNPHADVRLFLAVAGRPDLFDGQQRLSLIIRDRTVRELLLDSNLRISVEEILSVADLGEDDSVRLELQVDRTFVPAERDTESQDARELGVRVFVAHVEPM